MIGTRQRGWLAAAMGLAAVCLWGPGASSQVAVKVAAAHPQSDRLTLEKREIKPGDDELRRAMIERYNAAVSSYEIKTHAYEAGQLTLDRVYESVMDATRFELDLSETPGEEVTVWERIVALVKRIEQVEQARMEVGRASAADVSEAHVRTLDAEVHLLQAKRRVEDAKKSPPTSE